MTSESTDRPTETGLRPGAVIRHWRPGHAEHGMRGTIAQLLPGMVELEPPGLTGSGFVRPTRTLPLERVATEDVYQRARALYRSGELWPK